MLFNFIKILLILFTVQLIVVESIDWLDTFDLKETDQSIKYNSINELSNEPNNEQNKKASIDLNLDFSKIDLKTSNNRNENQIETDKINQTNLENKIKDFELNSPKSEETNQINSTLSKHPRLFSINLDKDNLLTLFWTINYEQKHILFELKFNLPIQVNSPFLAFGFSSYGQFENADFCILWNDYKNKFHFQDVWTDSNSFINLDKQNDCELLSTKKINNQIYLLFKRKFNTCDKNDFKLEKGTHHLVYALGNGQLEHVYGIKLSNIKRKGLKRVSLFKSKQIAPILDPDEVSTIEFKTPKIIIPSDETTYWCSIHKFPELFKQKQHIVRYESVIQSGNEQLVHHMELFHCEVEPDQQIPNYDGSCTGPNVPAILSKCRKVIAAWAMGATPLSYPEEAGLSVGGTNFSLYVMQETHYNNPDRIANRADSSGMRLYYTNKLRKHDIGIIEIGLEYTAKNSIPPGQVSFDLQGHCVPECTRVGLPPSGINIVAAQLHTHLTGIKTFTKHYREGRELEELNRDNYYSTHFQEIRLLDKPVNIQPGDALVNHCIYSTADRVNITLGGFGIRDEMCVSYLHYYPQVQLEVCKSSVDTNYLFNYFNYIKKVHNQPLNLVNNSELLDEEHLIDAYKNIKWNPYQVELLRNLYNQAPLSMQCNQSTGDRFPGLWNGVALTPVFKKLEPKEDECLLDEL